MTLIVLAVFAMLLFLPIVTLSAVLLGSRIFHAGQQGQAPSTGLTVPRFSFSRHKPNGAKERPEADKLPAV